VPGCVSPEIPWGLTLVFSKLGAIKLRVFLTPALTITISTQMQLQSRSNFLPRKFRRGYLPLITNVHKEDEAAGDKILLPQIE